jgi:hypothetical protein
VAPSRHPGRQPTHGDPRDAAPPLPHPGSFRARDRRRATSRPGPLGSGGICRSRSSQRWLGSCTTRTGSRAHFTQPPQRRGGRRHDLPRQRHDPGGARSSRSPRARGAHHCVGHGKPRDGRHLHRAHGCCGLCQRECAASRCWARNAACSPPPPSPRGCTAAQVDQSLRSCVARAPIQTGGAPCAADVRRKVAWLSPWPGDSAVGPCGAGARRPDPIRATPARRPMTRLSGRHARRPTGRGHALGSKPGTRWPTAPLRRTQRRNAAHRALGRSAGRGPAPAARVGSIRPVRETHRAEPAPGKARLPAHCRHVGTGCERASAVSLGSRILAKAGTVLLAPFYPAWVQTGHAYRRRSSEGSQP